MDLDTPRLHLRTPRDADVEPLARILAEPEVARFWPGYDAERVRDELVTARDDVTVLVIEHAAAVVGAIQFDEEDDPQYRHAGIDLFLGANARGRGLGPEAIDAVLRHLVDARGHHRVVIDPAITNVRAIRAYAKLGFRVVGTLARYERRADGSWDDGVLMEWIAPEGLERLHSKPARSEPVVRRARREDLPTLLVMMESFNRIEQIPWDRDAIAPVLARLLADAQLGFVGVVDVEGAVRGYFVLTWGFDLEWQGRDAYLTELYLEPDVRRAGVGTRVLNAVEESARAEGARAVHLMVAPSNGPAMRLYRRAGYVAPPRILLSKSLST